MSAAHIRFRGRREGVVAMHIEYLYYFKDFSRTLSISKTAAHYFMTPQGLSRALHQLEKDFGVTLMTYQNNLISLTPAGEELSRRIDAIVELYDEAKGSLTEYKLADMAPSKGLVRITVTSCVSPLSTRPARFAVT